MMRTTHALLLALLALPAFVQAQMAEQTFESVTPVADAAFSSFDVVPAGTSDAAEETAPATSLASEKVTKTTARLAEVSRTYRVQPGDLVRVVLPGEESLREPFAVNRDGRIALPEVGAVQVAGRTEEELARYVGEVLSVAFKDLSNLMVYIEERRKIVNVLGYVASPGEYILPADGHVQMALHAAGGMRNGAQINRLKLVRGEESVIFDYKSYLDTGDESKLPRLTSLDTLFIPASPKIGNVEVDFDPMKVADSGDAASENIAIKVFGEVNSAGSFSYKSDKNLIDMLMRAGGVTRYAAVEQIRILTADEQISFNLKRYLDTGDNSLLPKLTPNATIFVPRQEEEIKTGGNTVYVMGEVHSPGAFDGKENATFIDILANAGGPTRFAETRRISLIKSSGAMAIVDLTGFIEGTSTEPPPAVGPGDAIFVPEKIDFNEKSWLKIGPQRAVRVLGQVRNPGRIEWSDEMSLMDLLAHVGGPKESGDTSRIEIVTQNSDGTTEQINFSLDEFVKRGGHDSELPIIRGGSTVFVHELPDDPTDNKAQWLRQSSDTSIYIFGQVNAPGRYKFSDEMHFLDILSAADGPASNADMQNITINHRDGKHARTSKFNLALYFETGDESLLPVVKKGDSIYIPSRNRNWLESSKESTIRVLGAVNRPGRYQFNDNMTLLDLLAEAGGLSSGALIERITVVNLSCCKDQARTFDLSEFSKTARFEDLPVVRNGDTVYVPTKDQSTWNQIRTGLNDVFQIISLGALLGVL